MKKILLVLALSAVPFSALADDVLNSQALKNCIEKNVLTGVMNFTCPEAALTPQQHMEAAYKKLENALKTPEQRAALAAEQQAWLELQAKKDAFVATYALKRGGDGRFIERAQDLEVSLRIYQSITDTK